MTSEFDPDKWWTWPIPAGYVMTRRENGQPYRLNEFGWGWVEGFEAGRNSMAEDVLGWQERAEDSMRRAVELGQQLRERRKL